jgi:ATP-dependent DNA helicase RecQ
VGEKKLATYGEGVIGVLASLGGGAPGAAPTAAAGEAPDPDWPEMDAEPEPEDWI